MEHSRVGRKFLIPGTSYTLKNCLFYFYSSLMHKLWASPPHNSPINRSRYWNLPFFFSFFKSYLLGKLYQTAGKVYWLHCLISKDTLGKEPTLFNVSTGFEDSYRTLLTKSNLVSWEWGQPYQNCTIMQKFHLILHPGREEYWMYYPDNKHTEQIHYTHELWGRNWVRGKQD